MVRAKTALTIALAAFVGLAVGCGESGEPRSTRISEDGKSVTAVRRVGDKEVVVRDGKKASDTYDEVRSAIVLPEGGLAYAAKSGDQWFVMKKGSRVGEAYEHVAGLTTAPDGSLTYAAKSDGKWRVIKAGKPVGEAYESVSAPSVSPNGEVAYAARSGGKACVVKNGKRLPGEYDWTWKPEYMSGGQSLGFVAATHEGCFVVKDGRPISAKYDRICSWGVSADGQSVAVIVLNKGQFLCLRDDLQVGAPLGPVEEFGRPVFSSDGRSVAFAIGGGDSWSIWRDGARHGSPFKAQGVGPLVFRPDGQAIACAAMLRGKWFIVKDGVRTPEMYSKISRLQNGPDGKTLRFAAVRGGKAVQVEIPW